MAGQTPIWPSSGISMASSASDGIVCNTLTTASTTCPSRRRRAAMIPSGTPSSVAAPTAPPTSARCRTVRRQVSALQSTPPRPSRRSPFFSVTNAAPAPPTNRRAMAANDSPSISAAAFMSIMSVTLIRPASPCSACHAAGCRRGTSSR
ncbi:hypothetical protein D3C86_1491210 [compost metagenome]